MGVAWKSIPKLSRLFLATYKRHNRRLGAPSRQFKVKFSALAQKCTEGKLTEKGKDCVTEPCISSPGIRRFSLRVELIKLRLEKGPDCLGRRGACHL